jgi:tetratricopeptide (TPR) repeat protein
MPARIDRIDFLGIVPGDMNNPASSDTAAMNTGVKPMLARAMTHFRNGRLAEAKTLLRAVVHLQPAHGDALNLLGIVACRLHDYQDAAVLFGRAIALRPDDAQCFSNRGIALKELGRFDAAVMSFDRAIALDPCFAEAYYNRGIVLQRMARFDAAAASYRSAIACKPGYAQAHCNLGNALRLMDRLEAAIASYDQAIAADPCYAEAYFNRGNTLRDSAQLNAAIASFDQAIALRPDYAEAHWHKSLALLLNGDFASGWKLYEWRIQKPDTRRHHRAFAQPVWTGAEPLQGKTILLHAEQCLGDTIQFCRYATLVARRGARVILQVPKALAELLGSLDGVADVISGAALPQFDLHCPLLSLPLAFGTDAASIPCSGKYLASDAGMQRHWAGRLGPPSGVARPRVGLAWSGSAMHGNDRNRSIALADLLAHLPDGIEYVSLQQDIREGDRAALDARPDIRHFGEQLWDFSDTAALCELMDLVVSVDTSVAHLAGALGVPTRLLLPHVPDWRWMLERQDSPWYASMALLRQEHTGDWSGVFDRLKAELAGIAAASR